jgi:hypothetical protein
LLLALNDREVKAVNDVLNHPTNSPETLLAVGDKGGVSKPFTSGPFTTRPEDFRAGCISFGSRAARFAKMSADSNANESHLKGEARELRNLLTQLIGDGGDERADMSRQYRNFGGLTEFTPARR